MFLSITFDPEPGAMHGLPLARWMREHGGFDVEVLTAIPWYPQGHYYHDGYRVRPFQRETMEGVPVMRVPLLPSHDSSAMRRVATYVSFMLSAALFGAPRIRRPDVVFYFDNLPTTGLLAWLIARATGARTVQHIADLWPDTVTESGMIRNRAVRALVAAVIHRWCRFLYRRHARISVLSHGFKRLLVERGVPAERIGVVFNWAYEDRFFPTPPDQAVAERLGLAGKLNLVYGGNLGPLQHLETLIRGAALFRDLANVQLVIAGAGPREEALRALVAELALPNVRLLGRLEMREMNALNALSDAMIVHLRDLPFMRSTIPGKTQVALACGRPVLMGAGGDATSIVEEAEAGITFTSDEAQSFARAVRAFAALPAEDRAAMGERGRRYYEREMSLDVGASRMHAIFRGALRPARAAALPAPGAAAQEARG